MNIITKEKFFSKEWFFAYGLILTGAFLMAVGFVFFISPYKFAPGGVYGIAIVVHHLTVGVFDFLPNGLPIGMTALAMDIPLTIIGTKILGPRFGAKTVVGFVSLAVFTDILESFWGNNALVQEQPLLSAIYGGLLVGLGLGLIFKTRATSGGSDIIAMIIEKYTKIPLGQLLMFVDGAIVMLTIVAFKDWSLPLLSLIIIFVTGRVIDVVLQGMGHNKGIMIISENYNKIKQRIINDLDRGGTLLPGKGIFKDNERKILFSVLSRREVEVLKEYISKIDEKAFIIIFDVSETVGKGFKSI